MNEHTFICKDYRIPEKECVLFTITQHSCGLALLASYRLRSFGAQGRNKFQIVGISFLLGVGGSSDVVGRATD